LPTKEAGDGVDADAMDVEECEHEGVAIRRGVGD
jgi:hypothetical protein